MNSIEFNSNYNSKEVIEAFEKVTGLEYFIPEAFYFYYSIEIFKISKKSGSIKKPTILRVYENYLKLPEEEKQVFIEYEEKLVDLYQRKVYKIGEDFFESFNFIRVTDEICKVISKNLKKDVCLKCWLRNYMCMCGKIAKVNLSHKIYLIFHYSEILKASNTGKLLKLMDDKTEILIYGIEEYEDKIRKIFFDKDFIQNSVCLFPSKDSIYATEYYRILKEKKYGDLVKAKIDGIEESGKEFNKDSLDKVEIESIKDINIGFIEKSFEDLKIRDLNVFVIDGTWPQAISMMQIIPKEMVKLKIVAKAKNVYNSLRYRYSEETCSTIEAVATLLSDLGESEENIKEIYNSLIMLVDINLERKKTPKEEAEMRSSQLDKFEGFIEKDFQ